MEVKHNGLSAVEFENLKSHFATSSAGWGGRRSLPYAFMEHGAITANLKEISFGG